MRLAALEIQKLIDGNASDDESSQSSSRSSLTRKPPKFPRTQWLRCLLRSICGLAFLVFALNLMESSTIPSMNGQSESKDQWHDDLNSNDRGSTAMGNNPALSTNINQSSNSAPQSNTQNSPSGSLLGNTDAAGQVPTTDLSSPNQPVAVPFPGAAPGQSNTSPYQSNTNPFVADNFTYPDASHPIMSDQSTSFVERWCELAGTDWYPQGANAWKKRAPAFLMPGAHSSGIGVLTSWLNQHPQIIPPSLGPTTGLFFETNFNKFVMRNQKTTVRQARDKFLAMNYPQTKFQQNPGSISYDATQGYLFRSNVLPRRLFCVLPWIKLVVLLREPVERLYQHFLWTKRAHIMPFSLEQWIEHDMDLMRKSGLIANATDSMAKLNMTEQDIAWYQYQHSSRQGPLGRSLYEIQLRQWFQALQAIGRDPKESVLIVRTEDLVADPEREYKRILKFLHLSNFSPRSLDVTSLSINRSIEMKKGTLELLQKFFQPYNSRLQKLLKSYRIPYGSQGATTGDQK